MRSCFQRHFRFVMLIAFLNAGTIDTKMAIFLLCVVHFFLIPLQTFAPFSRVIGKNFDRNKKTGKRS